MNLKLKDIISPMFNEGLRTLSGAKLPEKTSYRVAKLLNKINKEQEIFNSLRNEKIKLYADKDKDGHPLEDSSKNITVSAENIDAFTKEMDELIEVEVPIQAIPVDDLGDKHGLTAEVFLKLGDFICD